MRRASLADEIKISISRVVRGRSLDVHNSEGTVSRFERVGQVISTMQEQKKHRKGLVSRFTQRASSSSFGQQLYLAFLTLRPSASWS